MAQERRPNAQFGRRHRRNVSAPEEIETMWSFALEIANNIDSEYVVTYTPTKPFATSSGESRKVIVSTHRDGVHVRTTKARRDHQITIRNYH